MKRISLLIALFSICGLQAQISISYTDSLCVDSAFQFKATGSAVNDLTVVFGSNIDLKSPQPVYTLKNYNSVWNNPTHIKFVKDSMNNWFAFVTNYTGSFARYSFGNSIYNTPKATNLGSFGGLLGSSATGVDIQYDSGKWYGFATSGSNFIRLDFGTSLDSTPKVKNLTQAGKMTTAVDINIYKDNGEWIGFVGNYTSSNQIIRVDFGASLRNNSPTMKQLTFSSPFYSDGELVKDQKTGKYYYFFSGATSLTLSRVDLGTNVKNNSPTFTNLGNPNSVFTSVARGLLVVKDCDQTIGFITDEASRLIRMEFPNGLGSAPSCTNLGSFSGKLKKSSFIGDAFLFHDSIFFPVINVGADEYILYAYPKPTSPAAGTLYTKNGTTSTKFANTGKVDVRMIVNYTRPNQYDTCFQITVQSCVASVRKYSKSGNVRIYPNPANEILQIDFTEPIKEKTILKIINMQGKTVYSRVLVNQGLSSTVMIPTANLAPGAYIAVDSANKMQPTRFVVVH